MAKVQPGGVRLNKAARDFNVGINTLVEYLEKQGISIEGGDESELPNLKISREAYDLLRAEFGKAETGRGKKKEGGSDSSRPIQRVGDVLGTPPADETPILKDETPEKEAPQPEQPAEEVSHAKPKVELKVKGKIALDSKGGKTEKAEKKEEKAKENGDEAATKVAASKAEQPKVEKKKEAPKSAEKTATPTKQKEADKAKEKPAPTKEKAEETSPATESSEKKSSEPKELVDNIPQLTQPKVLGKIELPSKPKSSGKKGSKSGGSQGRSAPKPVASATPDGRSNHRKTKSEQPQQRAEKEERAAREQKPATRNEEIPFRTEIKPLAGPTVVGKIDLAAVTPTRGRKPEASATPGGTVQKRRRKKSGAKQQQQARQQNKAAEQPEISMEDVEEKIKQTRARIASKKSSTFARSARSRRDRRQLHETRREEELERQEMEKSILHVSEFVTVNELAGLMDIPVTDVITTCMNLGMMVSINQHLDAESLQLVADEFGFEVEFVEAKIEIGSDEPEDLEEDLEPRPPVFVVLGHVDHGKSKLCDAIRKANVTATEAGGITQHLSAYSVTLANGRNFTLIDTPGHKAFTAMRARGAKLTDVAIIVVSAEDGVMPQTLEALSAASLAGARIVFAINKIDSPRANPEKVKEELSQHNYLVEEWGGKYQSQEISAKLNQNVGLLLEKVLLESDVMDLKANPNRRAEAAVLESTVDRGRGHLVTVLVQRGTLRKGDSIVSGGFFGRVKLMLDDQGREVESAGPSMPVQVAGLNGAPQAGDTLNVVEGDREARQIASKVSHIRRVQEMSARKHITLDEIGRRIAIGNFQELNLVVKGDVDGSVEALSDSLIGLSTEEIQVNVVHRGVGQISESDVTMAATTNSIIIGFQVRPSQQARRLADEEEIDIRIYSVIYEAIEEVKSAMEGMLSPEIKEEVTGTAEVLETFRISKVGTIAGCIVREGRIKRGDKVRVIRDGVVIYSSEISSVQRGKDEAREVINGMECGLGVKNYNDVKIGDYLEVYTEKEIRRTL